MNSFLDRDNLDRVKAAIDLRYIALGSAPKRGSDLPVKMRCLWHEEKTPSLTIWRDHYFCFGCQAGGDLIAWLQRAQGLRFAEAVKVAAEMAGIDPGAPVAQKRPSWRSYPAEEVQFWFAGHIARGSPGLLADLTYQERAECWRDYATHDDHRRYVRFLSARERLKRLLREGDNGERAAEALVAMIEAGAV